MGKFDYKWVIIFLLFALGVTYFQIQRLREGSNKVLSIYSFDFSPDGKKIVTAPFSIWDVEKGERVHGARTEIYEHEAYWSPDGEYAALLSSGG